MRQSRSDDDALRVSRQLVRDERARDSARALQDVGVRREATLAKTARLRALRMARETRQDRRLGTPE